jgi:hypothetical protein
MVNKVITDFNTAIQQDDFTDFFNSTAERWRYRGKSPEVINNSQRGEDSDPENRDQRLTKTNIRIAFAAFLEQKINLTPLLGKKILFDAKPVLSSEGVLNLEGRYEDYLFHPAQKGGVTEPFVFSFKVEFFNENSSWKLFGFHPHIYSPKLGNK